MQWETTGLQEKGVGEENCGEKGHSGMCGSQTTWEKGEGGKDRWKQCMVCVRDAAWTNLDVVEASASTCSFRLCVMACVWDALTLGRQEIIALGLRASWATQ